MANSKTSEISLQAYSDDGFVPRSTLFSRLITTSAPYIELARLQKPLPILGLFLPSLSGLLLAASIADPLIQPSHLIFASLLILLNSTVIRSVGCTWNDVLDRDVDSKVSRTRSRPIPRGAVSPKKALIFCGLQLLVELLLLQLFPRTCLRYTFPWLIIIAIYPMAKRVTDYTQLVLGPAFSWGIILAFPTLGLGFLSSTTYMIAAGYLFTSSCAWIVGWDFIYAHQDLEDDSKAGIKSMAVRHQRAAKSILIGLGVAQVSLLVLTGRSINAGPLYFLGSCGGTAVALCVLLNRVVLRDPQSCSWWFKHAAWQNGIAVASGLLLEYVIRLELL